MTAKNVNLTVQKWGNSLAVRIPAAIARSAHFQIGTPVNIVVQDHSVIVRTIGEPQLTLDERLELFDPDIHGGEMMASKPIGLEKF